jgi:hypothetical protein
MDDLKGYCRAVDRLNRAKRRAQFRQELADGQRVLEAAKAAGLPIRGATIAGVTLELGAPGPAPEATLTPLQAWRAKRARQA